MYQVCVPLQNCCVWDMSTHMRWNAGDNDLCGTECERGPNTIRSSPVRERSASIRCTTSIFCLLGNNYLSLESEPLGTFPVLSQQLPDLGPRSKVDLQNISRVRVLILDLSLACQFRMSSNDVHLIQVLSSETWDGWVLRLGSVNITDDLAFWVVADNSTVFESCDPEVSDSVHC